MLPNYVCVYVCTYVCMRACVCECNGVSALALGSSRRIVLFLSDNFHISINESIDKTLRHSKCELCLAHFNDFYLRICTAILLKALYMQLFITSGVSCYY